MEDAFVRGICTGSKSFVTHQDEVEESSQTKSKIEDILVTNQLKMVWLLVFFTWQDGHDDIFFGIIFALTFAMRCRRAEDMDEARMKEIFQKYGNVVSVKLAREASDVAIPFCFKQTLL